MRSAPDYSKSLHLKQEAPAKSQEDVGRSTNHETLPPMSVDQALDSMWILFVLHCSQLTSLHYDAFMHADNIMTESNVLNHCLPVVGQCVDHAAAWDLFIGHDEHVLSQLLCWNHRSQSFFRDANLSDNRLFLSVFRNRCNNYLHSIFN